MKIDERSEYSYVGLGDFFSGKSLKICSRSILIFRGLICDFFRFNSLVKKKANSTIQQQKCKDHKKRVRLLILKIEKNYQISQRNKKFTN